MKLTSFCKLLLPVWAILAASSLLAQSDAILTLSPPAKLTAKTNGEAATKLAVQLKSGYHVNSNHPNEDYLIPLRLSWEAGPLSVVDVVYPKPQSEKYDFSQKPLSVFTGSFEITTRFKSTPGARKGPGILSGKLRYQACTNTMCFPPKTVEVQLPYMIQ